MKRIIIATFGCFALAAIAFADEPAAVKTAAPKKPAAAPATPAKPGSLRFQDLDDVVEPLDPVAPRTAAEQARINGRAWYATGRILEESDDNQGALAAYKKALSYDPNAVTVYRALVPLAIALGLNDDAIKWAMKAVEIDPGDYELLRKLGIHQATQGDLAGGLRLMEQAIKSPELKHDSPIYVELMRDLAILYKSSRRPQDAARCFEVLFDAMQSPDKYNLDFRSRSQLLSKASDTYERIGQAFLEAKRTELAIKAFRKAAETRKGGTGNLSFNISQVYLQDNQPEPALAELQKYFDEQRQTKGRAAYELLGSILLKMKKQDELLPRLKTLAEKDSRNSVLQYFLADQYAAAGRFEEAEKLYRETLKTSADVQGYLGLATVYRKQNRPDELLGMLTKAYGEGDQDESKKLDRLQPEFKAILADSKLLDGVLEAARKQMTATPSTLDYPTAYIAANLAADAKDKAALVVAFYEFALKLRNNRADVILEELGQYHLVNRNYAKAAEVFKKMSEEPTLAAIKANSLFLLTQAYELAGKTKEALEAIKSAQEIIRDHPLLHYQEGWVYYHSQQYDEAIKRFEKVIADFPQVQSRSVVRRAQFSLSNIHVLRGNIRKGEEILERVLKESPDDPSVNNDLGYLYADQGKNLEQADKMIRKAIATEPENGAYLDSMGWVLFKQGKAAEALPHLEKAVKNVSPGGGDETMWDHLGDVYDRLGRSTDALAAWKKALVSAKQATRPDAKLINRIEEKIKTAEVAAGRIKSQKPGSP
jgi:tetratricopeptide (TPR) repeat protein